MSKKPRQRKRHKEPEYPGELGKQKPKLGLVVNFTTRDYLKPFPFPVFANHDHPDFLKRKVQYEKDMLEDIRRGKIRLEEKIKQDEEKLFLLMDYFGIDRFVENENRWKYLAYALAENHVPAFQNEKPKGRKEEKEYDYRHICGSIRHLVESKKWSVSRAAGHIRKNEYPDKPVKTIESWYYSSIEKYEQMLSEFEADENRNDAYFEWVYSKNKDEEEIDADET